MGPRWHQRPRTFAPQASVMAAGVRDDIGYEYTCFMRGGEDARLHGHFVGIRWNVGGLPSDAVKTSYAMAENVFAITQSPVDGAPRRLWVDGQQLWNDGRAV